MRFSSVASFITRYYFTTPEILLHLFVVVIRPPTALFPVNQSDAVLHAPDGGAASVNAAIVFFEYQAPEQEQTAE